MRPFLAVVAMCLVWAGKASPQGVWFDIGSGRPALVRCPDDTSSWIEFSPYPFGQSWPLGTLVYAELVRELDGDFGVAYTVRFSDVGCGCGSDLLEPIALRFHYDEASVRGPESSTSLFRRTGGTWLREDAVLDTGANVLSGHYWGVLVGGPTFGIGPSEALRERTSSWGRLKSVYGGRQ